MNMFPPELEKILHAYKSGEISREVAQVEADKHRDKIVVHFYQEGFTIRHLPQTV